MLFFSVVSAFIFMQNKTGKYLGKLNNDIVLIEEPKNALDFSLQPTEPQGISTILSMGTKALSYDKNKKIFSYKEFDNADSELFFKVVLTSNGSYMLQYGDRCVGTGRGGSLTLTECGDGSSVLQLNKSDTNPNVTIKNVTYNPHTDKLTEISQLNLNSPSRGGIEITNTISNPPEYVSFGAKGIGIPPHII